MVLGITDIEFSLTIFGILLATPMALVGFVLGPFRISKADNIGGRGRGAAITGLVLCALPFIIWAASGVLRSSNGRPRRPELPSLPHQVRALRSRPGRVVVS